jgi:hypothetical protein
MSRRGWIGVDFDGTIAKYDGWKGIEHAGDPVPAMVDRVKGWLNEGIEVRIFTARASEPDEDERARAVAVIRAWCKEHVGQELEVTCCKDFAMITLWDDRCVQVAENTGWPVLKERT